jgi:hypothetical protein
MKNILKKICRENQKKFMFPSLSFPKIAPVMKCQQIWWNQIDCRQYGAARGMRDK